MKKILSLIFILCSLVIILVSCTGDKISNDVEAILNVICNTPNSEIYDPNAVLVLGTKQNMTNEEKAAIKQHHEELNRNLEELLGQYFSPGSFDPFLNSYIRSRFFADDPLPSKLVSTELISKDDTQEVVEAQVDIDGQVSIFKVTFRRNPDGLLYRVDIEEMQ